MCSRKLIVRVALVVGMAGLGSLAFAGDGSGDRSEECNCEAEGEVQVGAAVMTPRGFMIHTKETAPESVRKIHDWYVANFQFVPNLAAIMSESPALLTSYWQTQLNLQKFGSLTPSQNNVVQMSIAMENECQYCVAGHHLAGRMFFKTPEEVMVKIRSGGALKDKKLETLRSFALSVYENRGRVSDDELRGFLDDGFTRAQALDVVANVAAKVMSNFSNQLAKTPVDAPFKPFTKGLPFASEQ